MKHATHPFLVALVSIVLLGQAHVAQAAASQVARPDGTVGIKGVNDKRQNSLATPMAADGAASHGPQAATHFSNGASQLRQQVIEQRKAGSAGP